MKDKRDNKKSYHCSHDKDGYFYLGGFVVFVKYHDEICYCQHAHKLLLFLVPQRCRSHAIIHQGIKCFLYLHA